MCKLNLTLDGAVQLDEGGNSLCCVCVCLCIFFFFFTFPHVEREIKNGTQRLQELSEESLDVKDIKKRLRFNSSSSLRVRLSIQSAHCGK